MLPTMSSLDLPVMWGPSCPPPKKQANFRKSSFFCAGKRRFPSLPALSSLLQKAERLLKKYHCSYSLTAAASALQSQWPCRKLQTLFQGVCCVLCASHQGPILIPVPESWRLHQQWSIATSPKLALGVPDLAAHFAAVVPQTSSQSP